MPDSQDKKRYIVVYQFGKVASTSIVATLDEIEDVTAVQCHFLGEWALASIIPTITGADVPSYFFQHQLGQFIENTKITRRVNLIRSGKTDERLIVLSICRDPVEWLRSSLVQDIKGYLPILKGQAASFGLAASSDEDLVQKSLIRILYQAADLFEVNGGIDKTIEAMKRDRAGFFNDTAFGNDIGAHRILNMMLRPFHWFDEHFRKSMGFGIPDMTRTELGYEMQDATMDCLIARYEDISSSIPAYVEKLDLGKGIDLKRENLSEAKMFASAVSAAFKSDAAGRILALSSRTAYSRQFGY